MGRAAKEREIGGDIQLGIIEIAGRDLNGGFEVGAGVAFFGWRLRAWAVGP
jgi:hypothetical protein